MFNIGLSPAGVITELGSRAASAAPVANEKIVGSKEIRALDLRVASEFSHHYTTSSPMLNLNMFIILTIKLLQLRQLK